MKRNIIIVILVIVLVLIVSSRLPKQSKIEEDVEDQIPSAELKEIPTQDQLDELLDEIEGMEYEDLSSLIEETNTTDTLETLSQEELDELEELIEELEFEDLAGLTAIEPN